MGSIGFEAVALLTSALAAAALIYLVCRSVRRGGCKRCHSRKTETVSKKSGFTEMRCCDCGFEWTARRLPRRAKTHEAAE